MQDSRSTPAAAPVGGAVIPWLLFASGAVALVYEVVWQRQFALLFGSGAPAAAAVLAAYFAGLGAGAFVIGRRVERWSRPLRAYVVLEAMIGMGAVFVGPLLAWFEGGYAKIHAGAAGHPGGLTVARIAMAFAVIAVPTFCMGGTLPLLGRFVDAQQRRLGITAGWLYVVNTLGAALGALAMPFVLLPRLGLEKTAWLCAGVNVLLAAVAWHVDRRAGPDVAPMAVGAAKKPRGAVCADDRPYTTLGLAFFSGLATFALQVLWNRGFAQIHENSMYSFAAIVAVVILALAAGGQAARLALRRNVSPPRLLGVAWTGAGIAILISPWMFLWASNGLEYAPAGGALGAGARLLALAALAVFGPMLLLGVGLPALMEATGRNEENAGRALGRLLAANVAGSVIGSLVAGFLIPSWLGLWSAVLVVGVLVLVTGANEWLGPRRRWSGAVLVVGGTLGSLAAARTDLPRVKLATERGEKLVAISEGAHGVVAVTEQPGSRRLKLNNHYALGGTAALGDERMQAHLPLLLHPAPRRVAFLGVGTGITAGGAVFHPVEEITALEIVPEVISAARLHFAEANARVLEDRRTRVIADDARHVLRVTTRRYDVVIGDLVVPWRQGEGALFTLEQFLAARQSLAPGGVFCQWLPMFQMSETDVQIVARTFLTVFPTAQIWRGDFSPRAPAIALVGLESGHWPDVEALRNRVAAMQPDPANPQFAIRDILWLNFVGVLRPADLSPDETRVNREDRPWIELLGPKGGATRGRDVFAGRALQRWLDRIAAQRGETAGELPERALALAHAGSILGEMTLCLDEGNRAGAKGAQARLEAALPEEMYRALFP